ncbi:MAG: DUF4935 domain-containing protein [Acidimicrobiia bacterium]|nr:DUF4935 domain-containing protein [Acidimicrobiia bacterium]
MVAGVPYVLVDTNLWISHRLLTSPVASSFLYFLARTEGLLVVPEVVEREVRRNAERLGAEAVRAIADGLSEIRHYLGSAPEVTLPKSGQFEAGFARRMASLSDLVLRVGFTEQHARGALDRVIDGTPPNAPKNQQFKDSAIWEAALEVASARDRLDLLTADNGFYRDPGSPELAPPLMAEVAQRGLRVHAHRRLEDWISEVQGSTPALDREAIADVIERELRDTIEPATTKHGFSVGGRSVSIEAFATEHPWQLAITFGLTYDLMDNVASRAGGTLAVTGECFVREGSDVAALHLDRLDIAWTGDSGEPVAHNTVFGRGVAHLGGARQIPLEVRSAPLS